MILAVPTGMRWSFLGEKNKLFDFGSFQPIYVRAGRHLRHDALDGDRFDAEFEKLKPAAEAMTFMPEKDGQWRAAGYYIK